MSLTLSPIPPFPVLSDRATGTYNAKGLAVHNHLSNTFVPQMQALLPVIDNAVDASAAAVAAANFKGKWSTLAGALAVPATVWHNNGRWLLLENLANVATEQPGVSAKWASLTGTLDLISTTSAVAVAMVEWTNFEALASSYRCLRLVASGLIGSAASANLNGQIKISGTFQAATAWVSSVAGGGVSGVSLSSSNQLKNTVSKALALDLDVYSLGTTQLPAVTFVTTGGHDAISGATYPLLGGANFLPALAPTTPIQGLRIAASTGTLTGSFCLYGVRK